MHPNAFGGRAPPVPAAGAIAPPDTLAVTGDGREGHGEEGEEKGRGRREVREGRERGREREGEGIGKVRKGEGKGRRRGTPTPSKKSGYGPEHTGCRTTISANKIMPIAIIICIT